MIIELKELGQQRFVGDRTNKVVHDRWHDDSEGCCLEEALKRGDAVGFNPDTLDDALWEGYEYCEHCMDKTEPSPPKWARGSGGSGGGEAARREPPSAPLRRRPG